MIYKDQNINSTTPFQIDLTRTRRSLFAAQDAEKAAQRALADAKHKTLTLERMAKSGPSYGSLDQRPASLVAKYGELYSQLRLETLDELDKMPELINSEELKNKLLFSVVVVSEDIVKVLQNMESFNKY